MSYFTQISLSDSANLDAFSRLRVSNPDQLFSTQCQYNAAPIQMESGLTGAGTIPTHNANTRMVALTSTGVGTSFMQSYQYSPYAPGKSHFIAITGVLGTGVAGATADFGYFDSLNGVIFRQNGATNLQFILRTATSGAASDANIVAQSAWNIDKMDGTGVSGITFDVTKAFILVIDLQFLGMGRVRVGFDINGIIYYAHQFLNANVLAVPYMQSATLPVGILVTTTAGAKTAHFKCASVISEGGSIENYGFRQTINDVTATAGNGVHTSIFSIRPKTTFNGLPNRTLFLLETLNILNLGSKAIHWHLLTNATFTVAPTWADIDATNSAFQVGTGGTYTDGTGNRILSGYVVNGTGAGTGSAEQGVDHKVSLHHPIALNRAGAVTSLGTLSFVAAGNGGTSVINADINFTEIR